MKQVVKKYKTCRSFRIFLSWSISRYNKSTNKQVCEKIMSGTLDIAARGKISLIIFTRGKKAATLHKNQLFSSKFSVENILVIIFDPL